jgi:hypothetical protein
MNTNRTLSNIAIGNSGIEALVAYVAKCLFPAHKQIVEEQLEAFVLSNNFSAKKIDRDAKFKEYRHSNGFIASQGGILWQVTWEDLLPENNADSQEDNQITLPIETAHLLHQVNLAQASYNQAHNEMVSMRHKLFSDWYKYMECAYPSENGANNLPAAKTVKSFIENEIIILERKEKEVGTFNQKDFYALLKNTILPKQADNLAGNLTHALWTLCQNIHEHNQQIDDKKYALQAINAPRYYEPCEPVVLLEGDAVAHQQRHGFKGRMVNRQPLTCTVATPHAAFGTSAFFEEVTQCIDQLPGAQQAQSVEEKDGFHLWQEQAWHPFRMDWQASIYPVNNLGNTRKDNKDYDSKFIENNFALPLYHPDLDAKVEQKEEQTICRYQGSTLLTQQAKPILQQALLRFITTVGDEELLSAFVPSKESNTILDDGTKHSLEKEKTQYKQWVNNRPVDDSETAYDAWLKKVPGLLQELSNTTEEYLKQISLEAKINNPVFLAIGIYNYFRNINTLSQALTGLNDALLMHSKELQLPIADPLGDADFAARVLSQVQGESKTAPVEENAFLPIRSGVLTLDKLDVVDTFGQVHSHADTSQLITTEQLTPTVSYDEKRVLLRPRVVQPCRLSFRWLSAKDGDVEMNSHPATSPICGWLLPNLMDYSLLIYSSGGAVLGEIDRNAQWQAAPGSDVVTDLDGIDNPHLRKVLKKLLTQPTAVQKAFFTCFTEILEQALEEIDPEHAAHHEDITFLLGHPIAIVRAKLGLQLKGEPSVNQSWNAFKQDIAGRPRDTDGAEQVTFPIRIGENGQFNDGTLGYWLETEQGDLENRFQTTANIEQPKSFQDEIIAPYDADDPHLTLRMGQSRTLTLLVNPHGSIHASSGILPVKEMRIPPDQYTHALRAMDFTFLARPILTSRAGIAIPLPNEAGYQWSYLMKDRFNWFEVSEQGTVDKALILNQIHEEGEKVWEALEAANWIMNVGPAQATVVPKEARSETVPELLQKHQETLEAIFDQGYLKLPTTVANFSGGSELREGWLKLRRDEG